MTTADRILENKKIDDKYAAKRGARESLRLSAEYRAAIAEAERVMSDNPRSHAQNNAAREKAVAEVKDNPRYTRVVK